MAKIGFSIKGLFVIVAGLIVIGGMQGCGPPLVENRTPEERKTRARAEQISAGGNDRETIKEESEYLPKDVPDSREKSPHLSAATHEFVGPAPNMAYLEFFEALNARYGGSEDSGDFQR